MTDQTSSFSTSRPIKDGLTDHTGLVLTTMAFVLLVLRVLATARFEVGTALAILAVSDPVTVALGTLAFLIPVVLMIALAAHHLSTSTCWVVSPIWDSAFQVILGGLILVFAPAILLILIPIYFAVLVLDAKLLGKRLRQSSVVKLGTYWLIMVLWLVVFSSDMWLPSEVIEVVGSEPAIGYVLSDGDRWTSVLLEEDRSVVHYRSLDVISRSICEIPGDPAPTLIEWLLSEPRAPTCST
ncbi:MAG: hypothetical protein GEU79_11440 [Acidimicrobiia bacterium]|nr:hypothetical protein [Acidimicrobiia bacterium]